MSHTDLKGGKDGLPHQFTKYSEAGIAGMHAIRSQATGVTRASHPVGGKMKPAKEHTTKRRRK